MRGIGRTGGRVDVSMANSRKRSGEERRGEGYGWVLSRFRQMMIDQQSSRSTKVNTRLKLEGGRAYLELNFKSRKASILRFVGWDGWRGLILVLARVNAFHLGICW